MFDDFPKSTFEIIGADGEVRATVDAIATGKVIVVPDASVVIEPGDEMRRRLPNGTDETFEVIDPEFHEETFGIEPHFQVKVRRKGAFPHHTGGNFNINVSGPNARVNVGSTDNSTNVVGDNAVLGDIRTAITREVTDEAAKEQLLAAVEAMDKAQGTKGFLKSYQNFISTAADHMALIGPYLPALSKLLGI